jgi:hypothetical protein
MQKEVKKKKKRKENAKFKNKGNFNKGAKRASKKEIE